MATKSTRAIGVNGIYSKRCSALVQFIVRRKETKGIINHKDKRGYFINYKNTILEDLKAKGMMLVIITNIMMVSYMLLAASPDFAISTISNISFAFLMFSPSR
jgi:hypothetical protein